MEQVTEDTLMAPEKQNKASAGYVVAAAAIWALVLYSISSAYRPEPSRIALGALQVCAQTP